MTDRYDQDMILGYVEGDLSDEQRAAFEATLADDHELRQLVSQMRLDREALRSLAGQSAPVGLVDQVMQAQERDALLGDPAAPEPLPMVVPVSRRKVRRLMKYSAVAAVLLLSFGVMFMTLTPPNLLNKTPRLAQNETQIDPLAGTDAGLAMVDEDSVYDNLDERALGRQLSEAIKAQAKPTVLAMKEDRAEGTEGAGGVGGVTEGATGVAAGGGGRLAFADAEGKTLLEAESVPSLASTSDVFESGDAAMSRVTTHPVAVGGFAGPAEPTNTADALVMREPGPYSGYTQPTPSLPEHVQLVVASASPTQARRDIRDWAIANSARFVEEPVRPNANETFALARRSRASVPEIPVRGLTSSPRAKDVFVEEPVEHRLVLFVDDDQMPRLLAYLNRGHGQRADVVPIFLDDSADKNQAPRETQLAKKTDTQAPAAGVKLGQVLAQASAEESAAKESADPPAEADAPAPAVALSNRWVDIGAVWRDESTMRESDPQPTDNPPASLAAPVSPAPTEVLDDKVSTADADTPDAITYFRLLSSDRSDSRESNTDRDHPTMRWEDFLNWDQPLAPAAQTPTATQPAFQPTTIKQRRLEVIIRQVAESDLLNAPAPAPGSEIEPVAPEAQAPGASTPEDDDESHRSP